MKTKKLKKITALLSATLVLALSVVTPLGAIAWCSYPYDSWTGYSGTWTLFDKTYTFADNYSISSKYDKYNFYECYDSTDNIYYYNSYNLSDTPYNLGQENLLDEVSSYFSDLNKYPFCSLQYVNFTSKKDGVEEKGVYYDYTFYSLYDAFYSKYDGNIEVITTFSIVPNEYLEKGITTDSGNTKIYLGNIFTFLVPNDVEITIDEYGYPIAENTDVVTYCNQIWYSTYHNGFYVKQDIEYYKGCVYLPKATSTTELAYRSYYDSLSYKTNINKTISTCDIYDSDGNVVVSKNNIDVEYEFTNGYHFFTVNSSEDIALSFDLCKFDSDYTYNFGQSAYERLEKYKEFDIAKLNPIYRYNVSNKIGDKYKTSKEYTFEDMQALDDDNIKIAWYIDFFCNDIVSSKKRTVEMEQRITSLLLDTDNFYSYDFKQWKTYNDVTADYSNVDYVIYYLRDNLYEPLEIIQPFSDIYDVDILQAAKYNLSKRIEQWVAYLSVTDSTYSELIYYKGFVEFKGSENGGTYTYLIDDKYINYLNNTNYAWVISFQSLSDFDSDTSMDLIERKFVDYFIYNSKSHFLQMDCPYGNGIDNDKSLIFKNENLGSILDDNIAGSFGSDGSFTPITSSDNSLFDDFTLDSDGIKELGSFIKSIFSLIYNALPSEVVAIFGVLLSAYIIIGFVKLIIPLG